MREVTNFLAFYFFYLTIVIIRTWELSNELWQTTAATWELTTWGAGRLASGFLESISNYSEENFEKFHEQLNHICGRNLNGRFETAQNLIMTYSTTIMTPKSAARHV